MKPAIFIHTDAKLTESAVDCLRHEALPTIEQAGTVDDVLSSVKFAA